MQLRPVFHFLYPPVCLLCKDFTASTAPDICQTCQAELTQILEPICLTCGIPINTQDICSQCTQQAPLFAEARSPFLYKEALKPLIHQFKYGAAWRIGNWLAQHMADLAQNQWPLSKDYSIVPVPMHPLKHAIRGFSSAHYLAQQISKKTGLPLIRGLRQKRVQSSQTHKSAQARHQSLTNLFEAKRNCIEDRRILLIDDVMTTGATAYACAAALKRRQAAQIYVLTAARTPIN